MSFRQTRFQWLPSFFKPRSVAPPRPRRHKVYATKKKWRYVCPLLEVSGIVHAFTRSEARSEIKKAHNLKGRVPFGSMITQVG